MYTQQMAIRCARKRLSKVGIYSIFMDRNILTSYGRQLTKEKFIDLVNELVDATIYWE